MSAALAFVDAVVLRRTVRKLPDSVAKPVGALGKAATGGGLWAGFAAVLSVLGQRGRRAAGTALAAYGAASVTANGPAKWVTRRKRPHGPILAGLRRHGHRPSTSSFPSSHTAAAVAFAVAASAEYPPATPVMMATATAVAVSRMRAVRHYPTDILGGVVLGCAIGGVAVLLSRRRRARRAEPEPH